MKVKLPINKGLFKQIEKLTLFRTITTEKQVEQSFTLMLGLYNLPEKDRVDILTQIAKSFKSVPDGK